MPKQETNFEIEKPKDQRGEKFNGCGFLTFSGKLYKKKGVKGPTS